MKKFTETRIVNICHEMSDEPEKEITVTVTNDSTEIYGDDDMVLVEWFSERYCKKQSECFDGMPSDDEIADLVKRREGADAAWIG